MILCLTACLLYHMKMMGQSEIKNKSVVFNTLDIVNSNIVIFIEENFINDENYTELFRKMHYIYNGAQIILLTNSSITTLNDYLLEIESKNIQKYHEEHPIALYLDKNYENMIIMNCYYSGNYLHSSPTCSNFAVNLYLKFENRNKVVHTQFEPAKMLAQL